MKLILKVADVFYHWSLFFVLIPVLFSCDQQLSEDAEKTLYNGPLRTIYDAEIIHSDSGRMKAKILTNKVFNYQNDDREAPEGLFITFFEKDGTKSATLKADYAYFTQELNIWKAQGNVIVRNLKNQETLKTEELFWDPATGDVNTEKFVKIETPEEIITGTGLKAKQDFSSWSLKHPEGIFVIEDEEGTDDI
jgi:LPS export ABC transporter protein LptC